MTLIKAGVKIFATETLNINNPSPYIHYITIHLLNQTDFSDFTTEASQLQVSRAIITTVNQMSVLVWTTESSLIVLTHENP